MVYLWPLPPMGLFALMAATNPPPYIVNSGVIQRITFAVAALGMLATTARPRMIQARNFGALAATVACAWRVGILVLNGQDRGYDGIEILAFTGVWVVVALMVVQMTVLTWPIVAFGRGRK